MRIELTSGVWKTPALPLDESRLVAGVGIEPTRAEDYETSLAPCVPASHHSIVKELVGDLGLEPRFSCSQGKRVKPFPKSPKMKKAGILSDPASEKSYYSKSAQVTQRASGLTHVLVPCGSIPNWPTRIIEIQSYFTFTESSKNLM